ncbi:uncharacterized protein BJX67DRAFT_367061 [Aspergillus lucknowensis]|uniref:Cellulase n=1 Tax=Aspergillus lucknowensis TaxID=176173 RepID=A0ABR4L9K4_9EURO
MILPYVVWDFEAANDDNSVVGKVIIEAARVNGFVGTQNAMVVIGRYRLWVGGKHILDFDFWDATRVGRLQRRDACPVQNPLTTLQTTTTSKITSSTTSTTTSTTISTTTSTTTTKSTTTTTVKQVGVNPPGQPPGFAPPVYTKPTTTTTTTKDHPVGFNPPGQAPGFTLPTYTKPTTATTSTKEPEPTKDPYDPGEKEYSCRGNSKMCSTWKVVTLGGSFRKMCNRAMEHINPNVVYGTTEANRNSGVCHAPPANFFGGCGVFVKGNNCQIRGSAIQAAYDHLVDDNIGNCGACGHVTMNNGCIIKVDYVHSCKT